MAVPLQILSSGHTQAAVGPAIALFAVAPIALALPAGRLADRHGYHRPVRLAIMASCAGGLSAVLSSLCPAMQYPWLCLAGLLSGAGCNIGLTAIQCSASRGARDVTELKRVFSWLGIAPSVSNFLGPAIAGLLIDHVGSHAAFVTLAVLPLLTLWFARWVPREAPSPQRSEEEHRPAWDLLSTPMLRRLLVVSWLMSASWDLHSFVVPLLGHQRGFSASAIALVLSVFALAVTGVRLAMPVLAHRLGEAQTLRFAMIVAASAFVVYPLATSAWTMSACAACLGMVLGCSQPMIMTALHQITPSARHGEAIALRSIASNCSSALLPLVSGAAGALLGSGGLFWSMATVVGTFALFGREIELHDRSDHAPEEAYGAARSD